MKSDQVLLVGVFCGVMLYLIVCDIWRYVQIRKLRSQIRADSALWGGSEAICWSSKEGQIMTRRGQCLYDKAELTCVIESANKAVADTRPILDTLRKQMACGVKGHEMVYHERANLAEICGISFIFKCKNCGIEITLTEAELTAKQKEALKSLKIL